MIIFWDLNWFLTLKEVSISIESFIEGIAFSLILRTSEFGGGFAILTAMLIKLIPQKLGYSTILIDAGLNHFWENVLSLLAVSSIYLGFIQSLIWLLSPRSWANYYNWSLGVFIGIPMWTEIDQIQAYFFAGLAGIFLYLSLSSLFPILQNLIDQESSMKSLIRLGLANLGFGMAIGMLLPLVIFS